MATGMQSGMTVVLQVIEVLGLLAFAFSGFVEARRKEMDLVGVFTIAFITAFGGGTLRDLLLDRRPLFWVEHEEYTILVFILTLVVSPFLRHLQSAFSEKLIVVADAFGLGLFSALGASLAQNTGMPMFVSAMMGVITGIFGGILRDVLCNEIPLVFRRGQLYATCSFAGCWVFLLLDRLAMPQAVSLTVSIMTTVVFRLMAVRFNLRLPG